MTWPPVLPGIRARAVGVAAAESDQSRVAPLCNARACRSLPYKAAVAGTKGTVYRRAIQWCNSTLNRFDICDFQCGFKRLLWRFCLCTTVSKLCQQTWVNKSWFTCNWTPLDRARLHSRSFSRTTLNHSTCDVRTERKIFDFFGIHRGNSHQV